MIPISLEWRRPLDGAVIDHLDPNGGPEGMIRWASDRSSPIFFRVENLENATAVALFNARDDARLLQFVARYGIPSPLGFAPGRDDRQPMALLRSLRDDVADLLSVQNISNPLDRTAQANLLLKHTALAPAFDYFEDDGRHRLGFRPASLSDLIAVECAVAIEFGATLLRCAHCDKGFLIGPFTGRRTHSTYCSDRCRVAAMRARAKGGK